jgi:signal transduction histidine kinase
LSILSTAQCRAVASVFTDIGLGIVAVDRAGTIVFSNPAAATILGIDETFVSLEDWPEHYGIYLSDRVTICPAGESPLLRAAAGEQATNFEVFIQNQLGGGRSRWCSIDFRPFGDGDDQDSGALLLIQDVSERRWLSEEVARSNIALQQFATVAAHDLQEPLRSISGFADMLAQYQAEQLDEKSQRYMSKIKSGVLRMQILINDLLSYSRIQTVPQVLKESDCNAIVSGCIKTLNASIKESGAEINVDSLPVVMADSAQLAQLFQNLIGNALKFAAVDRPIVVHVSARRQSTAWLFSVEDNGIGIAPEFVGRIFRIFQRLHTQSAYSGTGIGLAICQTIVDRHGGRIWVESEPGKGSTFHFTIPARGRAIT